MYLYPDNLKSKAILWLWGLKEIGIIGVGLLLGVLVLSRLGSVLVLALATTYAVLTIQIDDISIMQFIRQSWRFFITGQQEFYWGCKEK